MVYVAAFTLRPHVTVQTEVLVCFARPEQILIDLPKKKSGLGLSWNTLKYVFSLFDNMLQFLINIDLKPHVQFHENSIKALREQTI